MRRSIGKRVLRLLLIVLAIAAAPAWAQSRKVVQAQVGEAGRIDVQLYLPDGDGPFPLVVMSHGSSQDPRVRALAGPDMMKPQAMAYAAGGFVVAVPIRRGYGPDAVTAWAEDYETCSTADYQRAGRATAQDILASLKALVAEPKADISRIVLVGFSAGGWGSLAAAAQHIPGLRAVVNFAGGRGSKGGPNVICGGDEALIGAVRSFAAPGVPQLWIYAQNDRFFGESLARRMHAAFTAAGGAASLVVAPPVGEDGHGYFFVSTSWRGMVDGFLRSHGVLR
jgi:dienelactone hydrolase